MWKSRLVLLGLVVISGCSDSLNDAPKTYPVTGKVIYKEFPLEGATVSFWGPKAGRASIAKTDENGRFELTAIEGENRITVMKVADNTQAAVSPNLKPAAELAEKVVKNPKKNQTKVVRPLVPPIYGTPEQTPLKETVTAKGPNVFNEIRVLD